MAEADLKTKVVDHHIEVESTPKGPVADDFMYDFRFNHQLPTVDFLGRDIPADLDAEDSARGIANEFARCLGSGDAAGFTDLFVDYGKFGIQARIALTA